MKKINEKPFELVGFDYSDFEKWCEKEKKNPKKRETKKEFFKLVFDFKLVKSNGIVKDLREQE